MMATANDENKAGYAATPVACWWAGVVFEVTRPFGKEQWGNKNKIMKRSKIGPTDATDGRIGGCRVACTRPKIPF